MAFATVFSITRSGVATLTSVPQSRGLLLNGKQVEFQVVSKLTGDTTGTLDASKLQALTAVYLIPTHDNAGAAITTNTSVAATFTTTDFNTVALSGLGTWTRAIALVVGQNID